MAESKEKNNRTLIILLILLAVTNVATLFLFYNERQENIELLTNNTDLTTEKDALTTELEEMMAAYDSVSTDNVEMLAQIEEQKAEIEKLMKEAEKHKDDAWIIYKLRKEAKTLREVMKNYLVTIDSLNTANQELIAQKAEVETKLTEQKVENKELSTKNEELAEKVKLGSKLKVVDLFSLGQRVKSNNVHRETDRARRVDKIKTCFTIDKNEVTKPGKKDVYLRIIGPDGEVLAYDQTKEYMFTYDGKEGLYSRKSEITYENEEMDMCLYWDLEEEAKEGTYIVEIYAEDYMMGTTSFELK
jgi:methionine-rich copper-binding protein CopC/cell division protein FtsL